MTLLEALIKLQTKGPSSRGAGICTSLFKILGDSSSDYNYDDSNDYLLLYDTFEKWPKFSGNIHYPVPAVTYDHPQTEYNRAGNMWEGAYGDLRKELLQFCIDELSKEQR